MKNIITIMILTMIAMDISIITFVSRHPVVVIIGITTIAFWLVLLFIHLKYHHE